MSSLGLMVEQEVDYSASLVDACADAEADGLTVVDAKPDQLFIDIDTKEDLGRYHSRVESLIEKGVVLSHRVTRSRSKKWHGYVQLAKATPVIERIALQAILGSDRTHEYLSYLTYRAQGEDMRIVFFEPKPEVPA